MLFRGEISKRISGRLRWPSAKKTVLCTRRAVLREQNALPYGLKNGKGWGQSRQLVIVERGAELGNHAASLSYGEEGSIPAIESAHAVAYGIKLAKAMGKGSVLINLSGRGDKDMDDIISKYGIR